MCGHIGVAGKLSFKEERIFKQGLIVDSLRGEHSTGVAVVDRLGGEPTIVKQLGNAYELLFDKRFEDAMRWGNRVLIGHNRYATVGSVNKANAHPFNFGSIYGAHNGTLTDWRDLDGYKNFQVDSQGVYDHMSRHSVEDTVGKIKGAWAFVWWNDDTQELNFLRNKERSFFYVLDKKKEFLFWASEWEMLQLILNRNGVAYDKINELAEDQWMRWPIDKDGTIGKPKTRKVEGKKTVVVQHPSSTPSGAFTSKTHYGSKDGLVLRQGVTMEVGEWKLDPRRSAFFQLKDISNPDVKIRMYVQPGYIAKYPRGKMIVGNISAFVAEEGGYYKVSVHTVRDATTKEIDEYDKKVCDRAILLQQAKKTVETIPTYQDHKGNFLTKKEWEEKYPYCSWCMSDLVAEESNHLTKDGDVLCPSCQKVPDVQVFM